MSSERLGRHKICVKEGGARGISESLGSTPGGRGEPRGRLGGGPHPPPSSPQWAEQGCEHFVCSSGKWPACLFLCPAVCPRARRSTSLGPGFPSNKPGQTSAAVRIWNSRGGEQSLGEVFRAPRLGGAVPAGLPGPPALTHSPPPIPGSGQRGHGSRLCRQEAGHPCHHHCAQHHPCPHH